jgi:hypothetical protein
MNAHIDRVISPQTLDAPCSKTEPSQVLPNKKNRRMYSDQVKYPADVAVAAWNAYHVVSG